MVTPPTQTPGFTAASSCMADTATPCHAKEPFAPITLNVPIEGPSSIPSPGKVSHAVVGGQCRIIKPLPKLRTTQPPTRPLLLKAGRPGAVASARQGEPSDEVILYRRTTRHKSHFDEESRYIPRFVYEAGDRVLVNDCEGTRPVWRHGVIADFKEWPPVFESNGYLKLYAVTYTLLSGVETTLYFSPRGCCILYDRLLSDLENGTPEQLLMR